MAEQNETPSYVVGKSIVYGSAFYGAITVASVCFILALVGVIGFIQNFKIVGLILAGICGFASYKVASSRYENYLRWLRNATIRRRYRELPLWSLKTLGFLVGIAAAATIAASLLVPGEGPAKTYAVYLAGFAGAAPLAVLQVYNAFKVSIPRLECPRCGTSIDTERRWKCMTCRPWTENLGAISNSFLGECYKCRHAPEYIECPAPECHALVLLDSPDQTIVKPEDTRRLHRCRLVLDVGEAETPEHEDLRELQEERSRFETAQQMKQEREQMDDIKRETSVYASDEAAQQRHKREERERMEKLKEAKDDDEKSREIAREVNVHTSQEADHHRQKQEDRERMERLKQAKEEDEAIHDLKQRVRQTINRPEAKSIEQKLEEEAEQYVRNQIQVDVTVQKIIDKAKNEWDLDGELQEDVEDILAKWREERLRKQMDKRK